MAMRASSRFPMEAWHYVTWALRGKYCKNFEDTIQTIKDHCVMRFGNSAQDKMEEYGIGTVKDIKDIICLLGEQGIVEFDTLNDSPNVKLWED